MTQSSPIPEKEKKSCKSKAKKKKFRDFCWALNTCVNGGKVARKSWDNKDDCMYIKSDLLYVMLDGEEHTLTVSVVDIVSVDWYSVTT